jgi:hypothetical protein
MVHSRRRLLILLLAVFALGWLLFFLLIPDGGYKGFAAQVYHGKRFGMTHVRGWCAGVAGACRNLANSEAVVLVPGGGDLVIDKDTGLAKIDLGDLIDSGIEGYATGYNSFVRLWVSARGIPRNSRKEWISIVQDPTQYFDKRSKTEAPISLTADAPPVYLTDGKTQVFLKSYETRQHDFEYVLHWGTKNIFIGHFYTGIFYCFEGPSGSDFVIVRFQQKMMDGSSVASTGVLDLRYGTTMHG